MIKTIGDLSALYVGTVDVSKATNITELIIGSSKAGYQNQNFSVLSLGNNAKLRKLNIQNCPNYTTSIDVSGCENIEEVYAKGTKATAVNLSEGGALRILELPSTITNLTLKNQPKLGTGLSVDSWANVTTLVIENCPNIEPLDIAKKILSSDNTLVYVRFTNINAQETNLAILNKLSSIKGVGDNGEYTAIAYLSGKYAVLKAIEEDIERMNGIFPHLTITARTVLKTIFATFNVVSQYGAIKGATVEINGLTYDLSSGTVKVPLAEGELYDYVIRYSGGEDRGTIQSRSDTTISKSYNIEFDIMTMKPEPNGKMQVLLTGNSLSISISMSSTINIDWGDGSTSNEASNEVSHTYTDGNSLHNISIDSTNDRIASISFNKNTVLAFWGIGNSKVRIIEFKWQEKLEYITDDLFYNGCEFLYAFFKYCYKLKEIPAKLFEPIADKVSMYYSADCGTFYGCKSLKKIPAGLFDPLVNLQEAANLFIGCKSLKKIPAGLFDKLVKVNFTIANDRFGLFQSCDNLEEFPYNLFDKNVGTITFYYVFKNTALKVGFLPLCKESNASHVGIYENCEKMLKLIVRTATPCTIDSDTIPSVNELKIYVPDSVIETYKVATNWSAHKDKIVGWSELTDEERQKYGLTI